MFTNQFIINTCKIPSFECDRKCKKPCQEHKSQECLQVLGSETSVKNMAAFWVNNAQEMSLMISSLVNSFAFTEQFTPQEFDCYKKACLDIQGFFQACLEEVDSKKQMQ